MTNLQEAIERICQLKGHQIATDTLLHALLEALPPASHNALSGTFDSCVEAMRTVMLRTRISDHARNAFENDVARTQAILAGTAPVDGHAESHPVVEDILLTTTRISTFVGPRSLSGASSFFFQREGRLFLVTNRHVFADEASGHHPDRIEIEVHADVRDLTRYATFSIPLYRNGLALWRQATDSGGPVDMAAIEIDRSRLPPHTMLQAFGPGHLESRNEDVAVGDALTIIGFPLGFHDLMHHLPVARSASLASAYGVRFQQQGCFLTDARTHRGSSGSPVLRRRNVQPRDGSTSSWQLLGVHSTRMDMRTRDQVEDESLGLNCAWYADVLMTLTEPRKLAPP